MNKDPTVWFEVVPSKQCLHFSRLVSSARLRRVLYVGAGRVTLSSRALRDRWAQDMPSKRPRALVMMRTYQMPPFRTCCGTTSARLISIRFACASIICNVVRESRVEAQLSLSLAVLSVTTPFSSSLLVPSSPVKPFITL